MISLGDLAKAGMWVTRVETGKIVSDPWLSKWGVSIHYHQNFTEAQIRNLTQDEAIPVLTSEEYWPPSWNALPRYLAIPMLAFSVLDGPVSAARALQAALGVAQDGQVGPETCAAADAADGTDPVNGLLRRNFEAQMKRLQDSSPRWLIDGIGWAGRQAAAMAAAMAVGALPAPATQP